MKHDRADINSVRENTFFILCICAVICFPFSEGLVSVFFALLLLQALVLFSWKHPSVESRSLRLLFFPVSIFAVYLAGMIFSRDISMALYELKKVCFWLIVPLIFFLSPALSDKKIYILLLIFTASVCVSSLFSFSKLILHDYFMVEDIRKISFISHIRFSFQVVLAVIILFWFLLVNPLLWSKKWQLALAVAMLWLLFMLFVLKSLLAIIAFIAALEIVLLYYILKMRKLKLKIGLLAVAALTVLLPVVYIGSVVFGYYDFKNVEPENIEKFTAGGRPYYHDFEYHLRENGYLVGLYNCDEELKNEWNKRGKVQYDEPFASGYPLSVTLKRYMTSRDYKKDSVGVWKLTEKDIEMIEDGVTNYKFDNRFFSLYPRIYETVCEIDVYKQTGDPSGKSFVQRIEFLKASFYLIKKKPLFGTGTGNWRIEYDNAYEQIHSKLDIDKRASSHNQYVNYMVKFGIVGMIWILFAIVYPVFRSANRYNFIFVFFLIFMGFANFGDANLETHMGLSFFSFFYSLFLVDSTKLINERFISTFTIKKNGY